MDKIQGLMFVRNVGDKTILMAVIDSKEELESEVQYEFSGTVHKNGLTINTTGRIIDVKEIAAGNTPDGLLRQPIWQT
jgi:hypothetical protein